MQRALDGPGRGYRDTIWSRHRAEDDRLHHTFRDGCNVELDDGVCPVGSEHWRLSRIDFLFQRSLSSAGASYDMTCGQVANPGDGVAPNCDEPKNPERYSDHRLVWLLVKK